MSKPLLADRAFGYGLTKLDEVVRRSFDWLILTCSNEESFSTSIRWIIESARALTSIPADWVERCDMVIVLTPINRSKRLPKQVNCNLRLYYIYTGLMCRRIGKRNILQSNKCMCVWKREKKSERKRERKVINTHIYRYINIVYTHVYRII